MTSRAIRPATPSDNDALLDLLFRSPQGDRLVVGFDRRPDFFRRSQPYSPSLILVMEDSDGLAGTVSCGLKHVYVAGQAQRAAYVFDLAVAERARGQGCATALLAEAESWAREHGTDFLFAHVVAGNRGGLASFARAGYRDVIRLSGQLFPPRRAHPPQDGARSLHEDDWERVARLMRETLADYDLVRAQDTNGLRAMWQGLPGYDSHDTLVLGRPAKAVLGLWDYSAVTRTVLVRATADMRAVMGLGAALRALRLPLPATPRFGRPFAYGLVLGGVGETAGLRVMFARALLRARERGLLGVVLLHDPRLKPAWAAGWSMTTAYHLVAKSLDPGPADSLGERPVWVDPADL